MSTSMILMLFALGILGPLAVFMMIRDIRRTKELRRQIRASGTYKRTTATGDYSAGGISGISGGSDGSCGGSSGGGDCG